MALVYMAAVLDVSYSLVTLATCQALVARVDQVAAAAGGDVDVS